MRIPAIITATLICSVFFSCSKSSNKPSSPVDPPQDSTIVVTPPPGPVQQDISSIDNAVTGFMNTYHIPGVSIAITKDEKLVYVKAYGQMAPDDNTPVKTSSLFRIASLSKQFTAVAILRLIEEGKLSLETKIFGSGGILGADYNAPAAMADITINQLLHHTSGNWPNDGTDPMFQQTGLTIPQLITWTLANYPDRGLRNQYYYSNFGYCLLGRVIEKISGKSYAQFVQDEVLTPAGISDMLIGGNSLGNRKENEVKYYGQGEDPYNMNVSRMDSHGGWLATASDLMRFLVKVDGFPTRADILQSSTETIMTTGSASNPEYGCGWSVNAAGNWWHTGSLPGTATEQVRAAKGFNWTILCNTRAGGNQQIFTDMDNLLWPFVNDPATPWETRDQF